MDKKIDLKELLDVRHMLTNQKLVLLATFLSLAFLVIRPPEKVKIYESGLEEAERIARGEPPPMKISGHEWIFNCESIAVEWLVFELLAVAIAGIILLYIMNIMNLRTDVGRRRLG